MDNDNLAQLRRKILLYTIGSVLFSSCLIAFIAVSPLRQELRDRQTSWFIAHLEARVLAANQYLDKFKDITRQLTSRSMIREKLELYNQGQLGLAELQSYTKPKLEDGLMKTPEASNMVRLDANLEPVVLVGDPIPSKLLPTQFLDGNDVQISNPHLINDRPAIYVAANILNKEDIPVGMDVVIFYLDGIASIVEDRTDLGDTGVGCLCLSDPVKTWRGTTESSPEFRTGHDLCNTLAANAKSSEKFQKQPIKVAEKNGQPRIFMRRHLSTDDFFVALSMDYNELYSPANRSVLLVIGLVALASLISSIGAYRLLRPLTNRFLLREEELGSIIAEKTFQLQQELTAKEKLSDELLLAKEQAESASNAKSEFLATMSHEIRTPLSGIMGILDILESTKPNDIQLKYLELIRQSSNNLLKILSDILDISRIEFGVMRIFPEEFHLTDVIDPVIDSFAIEAKDRNIMLSLDISPDVLCSFIGDSGRIRQVLYNLIANAMKYTEAGEVRLEAYSVSSTLNSDQIKLHFAIIDTGVGIPEDKMDSVFEMFSQADSSYRRRYGGVGLGLAIVKKLVKLMGGVLFIVSEKDGGTEVHVTLPLTRVESVFPEAPEGIPTSTLHQMKVLVAEDDKINQMTIAFHLKELGIESVSCVDNGQAVLEALTGEHFDVILMDVQMPMMDGVKATRLIRQASNGNINPKIPIIALTAHAMKGDKDKFLKAGMDEYLTKPVDSNTLASALAKVVTESGKPNPKE